MTIQVILRTFQCTFVSLLSGRDVVWMRFLNDTIWIQVGFNCHLFFRICFFTSQFQSLPLYVWFPGLNYTYHTEPASTVLSLKASPCQNTYFIFIRKEIQQFSGKTMHLKRVYSLFFHSNCTHSKTFIALSSDRSKVKKKKTLLKRSVILHVVFLSGLRIRLSNNCQKNFPKFFSAEYENLFCFVSCFRQRRSRGWLSVDSFVDDSHILKFNLIPFPWFY